ncbi:MAG: 4Fe-4S dicluster domain-containing protein [Halodesulfurarchaeum sp.]|nr:4Fe-4S dicluster domain-containing protein [Halodesulfurarchaeum sp.]
MTQLGMVIDTDSCFGCRACQEACKVENNTPRGAFWMHVFRYEEGEYPDVDQGFMPRPCQHCSEPWCANVCPTGARFKREEDGIVLTDYDRCIGCRYCEVGCPYGVNYAQFQNAEKAQYGVPNDTPPGDGHWSVDQESDKVDEKTPWRNPVHDEPIAPRNNHASGPQPTGVMSKCTFCVHRQDSEDKQGTTACAETCAADAIKFGDMDDPNSEPRKYLRENQGKSRFKLLEDRGTEPNIVYLGHEPSKEARPIEDSDTFKDPEEAIEIEQHPPDSRETEVGQ